VLFMNINSHQKLVKSNCVKMVVKLLERLKEFVTAINVEPAWLFYFVGIGMFYMPSQELYLEKACKVNLGHSSGICDNLANHTTIKIEVQKEVAGIQAFNGALQSVPAIVVAFFAGPLSDRYARKPFILLSIAGYIILNAIFLINSYWFYELKAEFLLFECLQDITGGELLFVLGVQALVVDTVGEASRTRRLSILDAFTYIGYAVGSKLGVRIKQAYGWVALFSTNILLYVLLVLYVALAVKEKKHMLKEEKEKIFRIDFIKKVLGIFKRLFRTREDGSHVWIMTLIGVLCLMQFFSRGPETVFFLFWKMQYGLTLAQYANMTVFLAVRTSIANWILIPFLSKWLQDTTLIIVSQLTSIVGITIHALGTTFPAFYASLVLFCFWSFGPTGTRSTLSKLISPNEIGAAFSLIGILGKFVDLFSKPFFLFLYKATVGFFPGAAMLFLGVGFVLAILIMIRVHFGIKRLGRDADSSAES